MGWRSYLIVKNECEERIIADKKNFVPEEWLQLCSSLNYREDYPMECVISPRFEVSFVEAVNKMKYFGSSSNSIQKLSENFSEGDTLTVAFGEVIDNDDFSDPVGKEYYFEKADRYHNEYLEQRG